MSVRCPAGRQAATFPLAILVAAAASTVCTAQAPRAAPTRMIGYGQVIRLLQTGTTPAGLTNLLTRGACYLGPGLEGEARTHLTGLGATGSLVQALTDARCRATGLQVSPARVRLQVGGVQRLTVSVHVGDSVNAPDIPVRFESVDSGVVFPGPDGQLRGVGPGSATIRAFADDAVSSEVEVTVEAAVPAFQFVLIPAGTFPMGSTTGFGPVHTVTLTRAFHLQTTEVTQAQWQAVMGTNPSSFAGCGSTCPVERVSWDDVQQFLTVLNQRDPGKGYRLPTEAEWEYAARAGTTGDYGGTGVLDQMGWYGDNSGGSPHPVGQKLPNAWGLYDMHGNVWEWVQDWYADYGVSPGVDPPGAAVGSYRVLRGGSWYFNAVVARSASRGNGHPSSRLDLVGFRLARTS